MSINSVIHKIMVDEAKQAMLPMTCKITVCQLAFQRSKLMQQEQCMSCMRMLSQAAQTKTIQKLCEHYWSTEEQQVILGVLVISVVTGWSVRGCATWQL